MNTPEKNCSVFVREDAASMRATHFAAVENHFVLTTRCTMARNAYTLDAGSPMVAEQVAGWMTAPAIQITQTRLSRMTARWQNTGPCTLDAPIDIDQNKHDQLVPNQVADVVNTTTIDPTNTTLTPPNALSTLRRKYFADAASVAGRYGVTFDDIVLHLWTARTFNKNRIVQLGRVAQLEDLVHAIACNRAAGPMNRAWHDLHATYERWLARRCRRHLGDHHATVVVQRFLLLLKENLDGANGLAAYTGEQPFRLWLCNNLGLQLAMHGIDARDLIFGAQLSSSDSTRSGMLPLMAVDTTSTGGLPFAANAEC